MSSMSSTRVSHPVYQTSTDVPPAAQHVTSEPNLHTGVAASLPSCHAALPLPLHPSIHGVAKSAWQHSASPPLAICCQVEPHDPRISSQPGRGGGWLQTKVMRWASAYALHKMTEKFSGIQVAGLHRLRDAQNQFCLPGAVLWLVHHTDNPLDAMLLVSLVNSFPRIGDPAGGSHGMVPYTIMKETSFWRDPFEEWLGTKVVFANQCIHLDIGKHHDGDAETARRVTNAQKLTAGAQRVMADGGHMVVYPEGKVSGPGTIEVRGVGAVRAFDLAPDGKQVVKIPVGLSYESLGCDRPKALFNVGRPFIIEEGRQAEQTQALQNDLQTLLVQQGIITLSGLLGAHLLLARDAAAGADVTLRLDAWTADVARIVDAIRQACAVAQQCHAPTAFNELSIDTDLLETSRRAACCNTAYVQCQKLGYLNAQGRLQTSRLGARQSAPATDLPRKLHWKDPLCYYGNRTLQLAAHLPEFATLIETGTGTERGT